VLASRHDPREVIADPDARYYGIAPSERTLLPGDGARLGATHVDDWFKNDTAQTPRQGPEPITGTSKA
jgi:hypothetical protein